jgi:hypothetical protein
LLKILIQSENLLRKNCSQITKKLIQILVKISDFLMKKNSKF